MLIALDPEGKREYARRAERNVLYRCPVCLESVILKQGTERIPHYAHRQKTSCPNQGETQEHAEGKELLFDLFRVQPWVDACEMEYPISERRADVWIQVGKNQLAVEYQLSPISTEEFRAKLTDYTRAGAHTVYILPPQALNLREGGPAEAYFGLRDVRIPDWVRIIHAFGGGRLYLLDIFEEVRPIFPVHLYPEYTFRKAYRGGKPVGAKKIHERRTYAELGVGEPINPREEPIFGHLKSGILIGRFRDPAFWEDTHSIVQRCRILEERYPTKSARQWLREMEPERRGMTAAFNRVIQQADAYAKARRADQGLPGG
jgi:hypothetical protein